MLRSLITALVIGLGIGWSIGLAQAQTPNGYINPPVYGTGLIPEAKSGIVTTTIPASFNHPTNLVVYNITAISAWTILLPNPPFDGQFITVSCTTSIASLTILSTDGSALASGIPNSCAATANVTLQWSATYNTWYVAGGGSGGGATSTTSIGSALFFARNYGNCTWSIFGDVGPCINLAIAAAAAQGGGTVIIPASPAQSAFGIATPIVQITPSVHIQGAGTGTPRDGVLNNQYLAGTRLLWNGAPGATMFLAQTGAATITLYNADVTGIVFDCGSLANIGFEVNSVSHSKFDIGAAECRTINAWFTTDPTVAEAPGTQDNEITVESRSTSNTYSPTGILFDGGPGNGRNVSYDRIWHLFAWFNHGDGIVFGYTDNLMIYDIETQPQPGATGRPTVVASTLYVPPNGIPVNGRTGDNTFIHNGSQIAIQGYQSASTLTANLANSCNGGGSTACGTNTIPLVTSSQSGPDTNVLNFASTSTLTVGEAINCGGFSSGVTTGSVIDKLTSTTVLLPVSFQAHQTTEIVPISTTCNFSYGVTALVAGGTYTITAASASTFNITAPAGGHSQSGVAINGSGVVPFTDLIWPFIGTATAGDTWTLVVPLPALDTTVWLTDAGNKIADPTVEFGASATLGRTSQAYPLSIGLSPTASIGSTTGITNGCTNIGFGTNTCTGLYSVAAGSVGGGVAGSGSLISGHGNSAGSFYELMGGENGILTGLISSSLGEAAADFGRYAALLHGYGAPHGTGSAQHGDFGLWGTASGSIAVRGTADGLTAGATNCYNIPNNLSAYGFTAILTAFDRSAPLKTYTAIWGGSVAPHVLARGAGAATTVIDNVTTTISPDLTRSNGTLTGIAATLQADTTLGCIDAEFTPPTSNVDSWTFVFSFPDLEVK